MGLVRRSRQVWAGLDRAFTDLLLPPRCARCDRDLPSSKSVLLCEECREQLTRDNRFCRRCGNVSPPQGSEMRCPECRNAKFKFDAVVALGAYRDALREAVLTMKRPQGQFLAVAVARLLAEQRRESLQELRADCLVPVPMYWGRRAWRGANSPVVLAEELSRQMGLPVLAGGLRRRRNTLSQKDLGQADRFRNVRGAFTLGGGYDLRGSRLLIVDDIMTTGATSSEAAGTLKRGGASEVFAVVVGRAGLPS